LPRFVFLLMDATSLRLSMRLHRSKWGLVTGNATNQDLRPNWNTNKVPVHSASA
jgi:hypothetical protein